MTATMNAWQLRQQKAAARKSKRKDNAIFIAKTEGRKLKPSRKTLIAQLDALCAMVVKRRDRAVAGGKCLICRSRQIQVWYHLIPRGSHSVRWDLRNSVGACAPCNMGEKFHRLAYRHKHTEIFGRERIEALEAASRQRSHFTVADLTKMRDDFKAMLEMPGSIFLPGTLPILVDQGTGQ